jgi:hypothetical protein
MLHIPNFSFVYLERRSSGCTIPTRYTPGYDVSRRIHAVQICSSGVTTCKAATSVASVRKLTYACCKLMFGWRPVCKRVCTVYRSKVPWTVPWPLEAMHWVCYRLANWFQLPSGLGDEVKMRGLGWSDASRTIIDKYSEECSPNGTGLSVFSFGFRS